MIILEENFKWHLEAFAFASELFICNRVCFLHATISSSFYEFSTLNTLLNTLFFILILFFVMLIFCEFSSFPFLLFCGHIAPRVCCFSRDASSLSLWRTETSFVLHVCPQQAINVCGIWFALNCTDNTTCYSPPLNHETITEPNL